MIPALVAMSLAGGAMGALGASRASARSIAFSKWAAGNQWQYAVKDMRRAGLNPMLAFQQGPASFTPPDIQDTGEPVQRGLSSAAQYALQGKLAASTINAQDAQAEAARAQAASSIQQSIATHDANVRAQGEYNWEWRFRNQAGGKDAEGKPIPSYFEEEYQSRVNKFRQAGFTAKEAKAAAQIVELSVSGAKWESLKAQELFSMFKGSSGARKLALLLSFLGQNVGSAVRLMKP